MDSKSPRENILDKDQREKLSTREIADQIKKNQGESNFLLFCCAISSLSGFIFGYSIVNTGLLLIDKSFKAKFCPGYGDIESCLSSSASEQPSGWIAFSAYFTSLFSLGAMLGSIFSGYLSDRVGRRATLAFSSFIFGLAVLMTTFTSDISTVYFSRMLAGGSVGLLTCTSPVYIAEIATMKVRGTLSTLLPLVLTLGLLAGVVSDQFVSSISNPAWQLQKWQVLFGLAVVPAFVQSIGMLVCPESPRWLMANLGYQKSEASLRRLRGDMDIKNELQTIASACEADKRSFYASEPKGIFHQLFCSPYFYRVVVSCGLQICNQLSGIGVVLVFGPVLISELSKMDKGYGLLSLYFTTLLGTLATTLIIDSMGRRTLLLRGGVGILFSHIGAGICSHLYNLSEAAAFGKACIGFICAFVFFFSISWGPVCWVYPPEIYPLHIRAPAVALTHTSYYAAFYVSSFGMILLAWIGLTKMFFLLAFFSVFSLFFVYKYVPETKGVNLEEMDLLFSLFRATTPHKGFMVEIMHGSPSILEGETAAHPGTYSRETDSLLKSQIFHV